jgi:hypothetical protein
VAAVGVTLTNTGGDKVTVAVPLAELLAWLVAVTVTACDEAIVAGAVYTPVLLLIVPAPDVGLIVHVTAVLVVFRTVAEKVCDCPPYSVTAAGVTLTDIEGDRVTVADAYFAVFTWLVAVTVTVCCAVIVEGAV